MRVCQLPQFDLRVGSCLTVLLAMCLVAPAAHAQESEPAPAHIAVVDGRATLDREGQVEPANGGMPLIPGDRLSTEAGRVEVLFPDGSALDVDEFTSVELMSPTLLRLTSGRVLLAVSGAGSPQTAVRYQIDTPAASATTDGPGEFRVAIFSGSSGTETELAVVRGWASLSTESGTTGVRAGERTLARDAQAPMPPQPFNSARFDAFDRWADLRRAERTGAAASAQYLPNDLRVYGGTFDRYGDWQYEPSYGYVWYPTVATDWRPYYNGYWSSIRPYGWTWIGLDVWSWPTHHYGRWGYHRARWFWIPQRRWASAWVSWGAAPGYVSWCPLGFDNRPVFALSINVGRTWDGWTVVPRSHFGRGHVRQWAVGPQRLGGAPFVNSAKAPVPPPVTHAVPRNIVAGPAPSAGTAVPRSFGTERTPSAMSSGVGARPPVRPGSAARSSDTRERFPVRSPQGESVAGAASAPRAGGWVMPRQPGAANQDGTTRRYDRSAPGGRPSDDTILKQPLQQPSRAYQRSPGADDGVRSRNPYAPSAGNPYASPGDRSGTPRWSSPGGATTTRPPSPDEPAISRPGAPRAEPPNAGSTGIAPRWYGRSDSNPGARQPSRRSDPGSESRPWMPPVVDRPEPPVRTQGWASPRSGPASAPDNGRVESRDGGDRRSNGGSGAGAESRSDSRSRSSQGGGGARQRRP